jgi:adenosylmethionine-8-amino-7-oxononanoate aminotransferase
MGFVDGVNGDAVMVSPPFIIEEGEIDEIIGILQEVFIEVENERSRCI